MLLKLFYLILKYALLHFHLFYVDYGARNIIFNGNVIKSSKEAAFCIGNEDNDINKNFKKCKNIVLTGNTFIENKINILKNAESFEYIEKNNIFID